MSLINFDFKFKDKFEMYSQKVISVTGLGTLEACAPGP